MNRRFRFALPILGVALLCTLALALIAAPWDQREEGSGETITYRMCNATVQGPPLGTIRIFGGVGLSEAGLSRLALVVELYRPFFFPGAARPSETRPFPSVEVDGETGQILSVLYLQPSYEAALASVLRTLSVAPLDPTTAPWPYTEATQVPVRRGRVSDTDYREPDPGAGLILTRRYNRPTTPVANSSHIIVQNCRSRLVVGTTTGEVEEQETRIDPADAAAFDRFLAELRVEPRAVPIP